MNETDYKAFDEDLLRQMRDLRGPSGAGYFRPMDLGAHSRSPHSRRLADLVRRGLACRRPRSSGGSRGSWEYGITEAGVISIKHIVPIGHMRLSIEFRKGEGTFTQEHTVWGDPRKVKSLKIESPHGIFDFSPIDASWGREWPTEPGTYWFFGWMSTFDQSNHAPEIRFVKVKRGGDDSIFYVTEGTFLHACEGAKGLWQKARLPQKAEMPL